MSRPTIKPRRDLNARSHSIRRHPGATTDRNVTPIASEALTSLVRRPLRTLLCALGTMIAVAAFVSIDGLTDTARGAVSSSFNALRATTVEFQGRTSVNPLLTQQGVTRLEHLNGVNSAGLLWDIDQQQPLTVHRTPPNEPTASGPTASLSFTAASPSALTAIGAKLQSGRLYDDGANTQHQMVALLGVAAAEQLGITSTVGNPAIFVGHSALTVVGIIGSTQQEGQVLLGVVVPQYAASVIAGPTDERRVIARTTPGAAQLIGRQGPYALDPYAPSSIDAEVPPSPSTLRASIESSLSTLLSLLALAGLAIGLVSIGTVTTLSVTQRRSEIGLRRALGYRRLDIFRLILAESAGVGILGGIIGTSLGVLTVSITAATRGWTPVLAPQVIALAPALGITVGIAAGSYPALRAMKVTPVSALRST
jgi:putative ABC transport system permease protein